MMDCIGEHHGLVERIWNTGVIGIWGAPIAMAVMFVVILVLGHAQAQARKREGRQ